MGQSRSQCCHYGGAVCIDCLPLLLECVDPLENTVDEYKSFIDPYFSDWYQSLEGNTIGIVG